MYLQQNTQKCCKDYPEPSRFNSLLLVANNSFRAYSLPITFYVSLSFISKVFSIELFPFTLNEMSDKDIPRTESASLGELTLL